MEDEIAGSTFKEVVVVRGYSAKGNLLFQLPGEKEKTDSAKTGLKPEALQTNIPADQNSNLTGFWPAAGDTVLMVLDSSSRVSLFARSSGEYYRFWSPFMTMSTAIFQYKPPFLPLPNKTSRYSSTTQSETCLDGCVIKKKIWETEIKTK